MLTIHQNMQHAGLQWSHEPEEVRSKQEEANISSMAKKGLLCLALPVVSSPRCVACDQEWAIGTNLLFLSAEVKLQGSRGGETKEEIK